MRLLSFACALSLSFPLIVAACGGGGDDGDAEPYDTFQLCFDDHHVTEGFDVETSIKICCIDHPIGGQDANVVCGEDQTACETFLGANLTGASQTEITNACAGYLVDRTM